MTKTELTKLLSKHKTRLIEENSERIIETIFSSYERLSVDDKANAPLATARMCLGTWQAGIEFSTINVLNILEELGILNLPND